MAWCFDALLPPYSKTVWVGNTVLRLAKHWHLELIFRKLNVLRAVDLYSEVPSSTLWSSSVLLVNSR